MKTVAVVLALGVALALQTILSGLFLGGRIVVNLVLVAVVYVALSFGPVSGLLVGMAGGLTQDALAGGIVGIGGLAKTLIGFVVGVLSAQFIVSQTLPRFVMFVAATFVHEVIFQGLHALLESRPMGLHYSAVLTQAVINGLIGLVAFWLVERGPKILASRRDRQAAFSRRRF